LDETNSTPGLTELPARKPAGQPEISVVIPVYRSAEIIPHLCAGLRESLNAYSYEVILVNDRSPDNSWEAIREEASDDKRFVGINLRVNVGQDRAIMAGLNHASGEFAVIMDDDLQHDPADITPLYQKILEGYDVCYANFLVKQQTRLKNACSWAAGRVAEVLIKKPKNIYLSPFKVIRREVLEQLVKYQGAFPYVDGLIFQITDNITAITLQHRQRHSGGTTHNIWKQAHVFLAALAPAQVLLLGCIFSWFMYSKVSPLSGGRLLCLSTCSLADLF
jgi:undecaprenyl-phosphate 4-deoxy-4-formamido-L-arabinose transferase